ncbi:hypothetical protein W59_22578 [Rhodococcus opacus RKJ300 = JCM 13270]|uniref:Uncharacterized protein n=1 Tax=Rhodococcus opacus RKJ300 = JCM 13270 TaxID=1165867 RepID=I0WN11_RHOOP|nr:hypothetical protein W59_22578 [Rhodococcus opacus RKJ300 = JCM 13270]
MRPSFRLDSFDRLAAASRGGDRDAMSRLHAAIRPMAIRRCRAELDPAVADSVADGACLSVLHMLADRPAAGEPFLHLLNTMTRGDDHPNRRCLLRPPCSTSRGPRGLVCARAGCADLAVVRRTRRRPDIGTYDGAPPARGRGLRARGVRLDSHGECRDVTRAHRRAGPDLTARRTDSGKSSARLA